MREVIAVLESAGATIVRANIPTIGWIGGPGTNMAVLNTNPHSPTRYKPAYRSIVFIYELKRDLDLYLRDWARETEMRSLADIVAFNEAHPEATCALARTCSSPPRRPGETSAELEYKSARAMDVRSAGALGLDAYMDAHRLDAVLFPGAAGAGIAAKPGYPSVQVPAGFTAGIGDAETPDYPIGATFTGRAWSEPTLLRLAYAYEQASQARRPPAGYPAAVKFYQHFRVIAPRDCHDLTGIETRAAHREM